MDKDHLPLLEGQNMLRRSKILAGTQRDKFALTEVIKNLSSASGREADMADIMRNWSSLCRFYKMG
ncbi:hypothetical protein AWC35_17315 [Gibbsiella quercinecans]|uniref:Uncharacterized protein n=1 Tax=Gibbsiella quercinecans TaxID=929813 RepID=A0A250B4F6_9GAMM|nr:hypothetical protein AWC35_17315 [Gibbsiella quercinecans]RLM11600.1 hypothetical protein BIY30_07450 [Gibbsiella quercinecans]